METTGTKPVAVEVDILRPTESRKGMSGPQGPSIVPPGRMSRDLSTTDLA